MTTEGRVFFILELFKDKLSQAQRDYNIRVAEGYKPDKRSPKRITILVSEAYLAADGSIHWVQDLEAEIYKLSKEHRLDCDELEMEHEDRSYTCRKKGKKGNPHRDYGKRFHATQFDNHLINETSISKEDIPLARAIIKFLTNHTNIMEDQRNGTTYYFRRGTTAIPGDQQGNSLPTEKEKRTSLRGVKQEDQGLSSREIHGVDKPELRDR